MGQEFITVKFDTDEEDIVHVSLDYQVDSISPEIVIQALYDLAEGEEVSWRR